LIRQLVEYKKFKDAAARLQNLEIRQEEVYPRLPAKPEFDPVETLAKVHVSIFDLINAVNAVLKRVGQREELRDIFEDKWTVSEKIEQLARMLAKNSTLKFSEVFAAATSRSEVVATFLALLELVRLRQLVVVQREPFGEIEITRAPSPPPREGPAAPPATGAEESSPRAPARAAQLT